MTHQPRFAALVSVLALSCGGAEPVHHAPVAEAPPVAVVDAGAASAPVVVQPPFVPQRVWHEGGAMGTHLGFAGYTDREHDAASLHAAFDAAIAEFKRLEALMTTWNSTSEVSRINAYEGCLNQHSLVPRIAGAIFENQYSPETMEVLEAGLAASRASEGAFDLTFETLHGLWKFDEDLDPHPPSMTAIRARLKWVGYERLHLSLESRRACLDGTTDVVYRREPGEKICYGIECPQHVYTGPRLTRIGLGGIAKGYAVDKASAIIRNAGIKSFFVQAGGDLYAEGHKPDGSVWSAGIRDPRGPVGKPFASIELDSHAFSTAGDYERSYVIGKKRYHHILDPRTGMPADKSRSVTVWAPTAFQADAVDDAVFVMGPEKGLKYVESLPGVGAVIVDAKNRVWVSERLKGKVTLLAAPTDGV